MNTAVAKPNDSALPAHLQGGKKASFGNIDASDLIIPRIKLVQGADSELLQAYDNAKIGQFWHTLMEQNLGAKLRIIPLILNKEIVMWAPRGDDRGVLARSTDCVNWDEGYANLSFKVKHKGMSEEVEYFTDKNVAASGLTNFGTKIPGDPKSAPAASVTYKMMFCFPDFPDIGPAVVINTRTAAKVAKGLISKIEMRPVDHYGQIFVMGTTDEKGDEGPYKGYSYTADGYADEDQYNWAKAMYEKYKALEWKTNDEHDSETPESGGGSKRTDDSATRDVSGKTSKF